MLTISRPAYERLSEMLADRPHEVAVRIFLHRGRARIRPGRQRQGDTVVEHDGRTVLLLDRKTVQHLDRRTLGIRDTDDGPRLKLQRLQTEDSA
ncbi:MAG: hypothetical protein AB7U20_07850 [Planctomycetaceae bacterium]